MITELNGWDAFSPGHLDQHLLPFYERGLADGTLTREPARELLEAFFVKFNNHPAPPKVGVTAAESGTYTDFANINLGGLLPDGSDGSNEVSHLLLDIIDEMHLLQPSTNLQLSRKTPDAVLKHALRVIRKGYGFPSIFNADAVVEEQLRQGKTLEDARAGGCSGCVEVGAFGKEAYILTGYFNLPKILELALHDGVDPRTGEQLGPPTGAPVGPRRPSTTCSPRSRPSSPTSSTSRSPATSSSSGCTPRAMPAPFLSVLTDDCIAPGQGLQRRRGALQQHLHPVRGHRQHHRQPGGAPAAGVRASTSCASPTCVGALDADFAGAGAAAPAAGQPDAQVRQRRRLRRRAHGAGLRARLLETWTAGPTPRAGATGSRCCPPPATSTSAR